MDFEKYKVLTEPQITVLKEVATLCPHTDGPAVHTARALLRGTDNSRKEYMNACEKVYPTSNSNRDSNILLKGNYSTFEKGFSVTPNPAQTSISLVHNGYYDILSIEEITGKVVFEVAVDRSLSVEVFDISSLANGLYILKLKNNSISKQTKLIINK